MSSLNLQTRLDDLERFREEFMAGMYPQPSAIGPNKLSKSVLKAKSITGTMIDVSDLSAVSTRTGSLVVDGDIQLGGDDGDGVIRSGKETFIDNATPGFWIGTDLDVPKINIGNASSYLRWDGTTLSISGSFSATSGSIGGWTINSTSLTHDAGAIGLATTGTYRIWLGSTTPSAAPFSVTNSGAIHATSGKIANWDLDAFGIRLGSGSVERGMDSGTWAFYAGGAPSGAPFRVSTGGQLFASNVDIEGGSLNIGANFSVNSSGVLTAANANITGTITTNNISVTGGSMGIGGNFGVSTGGVLTASGANVSGSITTGALTATGGTLSSLTIAGTLTMGASGVISWKSGGSSITNTRIILDSTSSGTASAIEFRTSGNTRGYMFSSASDGVSLQSAPGFDVLLQSPTGGNILLDATLASGSGNIQLLSPSYVSITANGHVHQFDSSGRFIARNNIFPGNQTSAYLRVDSGHIGFGGLSTSGSAGALAGYFTMSVNGTARKIPYYAV